MTTKTNRFNEQAAFVLHSRPYRESSAIIDCFTREHGRVSVIAKGCRRQKSTMRGLLQPFLPLLLSYQGQRELKTLTDCEARGFSYTLRDVNLFSAMYINELLLLLLHKEEPFVGLFDVYESVLATLARAEATSPEGALREFEKVLLESLGYGIDWQYDYKTDQLLEKDARYYYQPGFGFTRLEAGSSLLNHPQSFSGEAIASIAASDWHEDMLPQA